jgi:hypothetical protein
VTKERLIRWLLVFGLVGTAVELVLLEHYESPSQFVPFVVIALSLLALAWHGARPGARALGFLRGVMVVMVVSGGVGVVLHMRGGLEFQTESEPDAPRRVLYWKMLRAKAPPALAPGVLIQLGLLGLIYAHRPDNRGSIRNSHLFNPDGGPQ